MPTITNPKVFEILQNPYFDQHAAMHLARERLTLPDGKTKLPLILPPCLCDACRDHGSQSDAAKPPVKGDATMTGMADNGKQGAADGAGMPGGMAGDMSMIESGLPGSGKQLLEMHHQMIRVFRFLLGHSNPPLRFLADWSTDPNDPERKWCRTAIPDEGDYAPELWDLDDPGKLPHEIIGMLKVTDPEYLGLAFSGVKRLVETYDGTVNDAVDALGIFIEHGVKEGEPNGSGFHETIHEFLAAREGRAAVGAEMNKLNNARFNDYFWSLHLWIDAQYGRLLERRGQSFDTAELDPKTVDMCTADAATAKAPEMVAA
jgi:hypothetical protein